MPRVLLLLLLLMAARPAGAQTFYSGKEFGVMAGGSQYFGDLNDHYGFQYVRPAGGAFARYHVTPYISLRASLLYTQIGYDDRFNTNAFQQQRNLSFRSNVYEAAVQAEFNFFRFATGELGNRFTPYLTGGIGALHFNPYTELNGVQYDLRPLGTEGQNAGFTDRRYSSIALCAPIGMGFKYWLRPGLNLGFEIADRLTFTDYLDDVSTTYVGADKFPTDPLTPNPAFLLQDRSPEVSGAALGRAGKQRGNEQTKDQYLVFALTLSFQLKVYKCPSYLKEGYYMY